MNAYFYFGFRDGPHLRRIVQDNGVAGVVLLGNTKEFEAARPTLLNGIIAAIMKRFHELGKDHTGVIQATRLASKKSWPGKDDDHILNIPFLCNWKLYHFIFL